VNGVLWDEKKQFYPPHGSLQVAQAPPRSIVNILVGHVYLRNQVASWLKQIESLRQAA